MVRGFGGKTNAMQKVEKNLADAVTTAIHLSKESGYACIIKSKGEFWIEDTAPFIRSWEELIGVYEAGELMPTEDTLKVEDDVAGQRNFRSR